MPEKSPSCDRNYYADLDVSPNATSEQIRAAFHKLARLHHPDKKGPKNDGDSTEFRKVREAYETLSDNVLRRRYDLGRGIVQTPGAQETYEETPQGYSRTVYTFTAGQFAKRGPFTTGNSQFHSNLSSPFQSRTSTPGMHARSYSTPHAQPAPQYPTAHGVRVLMTSHPATGTANCSVKPEEWHAQSGTDHCIFCMIPGGERRRCPGCEALACRACWKSISERGKSNGPRPSSWMYRPSGG